MNTTTVFDAFTGTFLITDTKGDVLYVNKAIEDRTGYAVAEVIGKRPGDLWGGQMPPTFYQDLWRTVSQKRAPFIGDVYNVHKNGQEYGETLHIAPVFTVDGKIQYYIELHPHTYDRGKTSFADEFMSVFLAQEKYGAQLMEWVFAVLSRGEGKKERMTEQIAQACSTNDHKHLSAFLSAVFVSPFRDKFRQRQEDKALLQDAKEDPQTFWLLYKKYSDDILYYFMRRLPHKQAIAQELMQETFLRAFRYLPQFTYTNASYRTYLLRIAHNLFVNYHRQVQTVSLDRLPETYFVSPNVYDDMWRHQDIERAKEVLSSIEQRIVGMKYDEGFSVREIAVTLQKSENAIKLHLSRARKKMRDQLGGS
ncbi:sigma-70 family RNA polymerase sigma factor [Candidatus Parcubacteria bacterium]|nr:sigma-70 family RNA polymerase sigma factor [Candidatus Parcubacteria bacterium]